jgi:ubiquinone biosynthesis protein
MDEIVSIMREYRHFKRYREIVHVFLKHGLGFMVQRMGLTKIIPLPDRHSLKSCEREPDNCMAEKLSHVLMELGPTFIKLGQLLSTRPDLLPPAYIDALEKLQDKVYPMPYEQAVKQLINEIGHPEEIFAEFDSVPLAAASIGQVHRAVLKTGEKVIVKIQRPDIYDQVVNDLEILVKLARLAERRSPQAAQLGFAAMMEDYSQTLLRELDYDRESKNTERMYRNFLDNPNVIIPKVYWDYTTPKVLTEEYIAGVKFNDLNEISARGWDTKKISALGTEAFLTQVMVHGFFQADPHPGNMMVVDEEHIAFIDFGEIGILTGKRLDNLGILFMSIGTKDMDRVLATLVNMGIVHSEAINDDFQGDLEDLIERVYSGNIGNVDIMRLRKELLDLAFQYQLKMPAYMTSLMKALITLDGVGKKLDPNFNISEVTNDLAQKLFSEKMKPENLQKVLKRNFYGEILPLLSLPKNFNQLIKTTGEGRLNMSLDLGFKPEAARKITQLVNRIGASLLIAGGLVGGGMLLKDSQHPLVHYAYGVFGIVLFGIIIVGIMTFISNLRDK